MAYRAAVIGAGADPDNPTREGFAMGHNHADGYERLDGVVDHLQLERAAVRLDADTVGQGSHGL